MENRTALRGAGNSKWLIALFALIVVLGLGVMAGYVAKSVSAPAATHNSIVSTQSGPTCPLTNCNLRSTGSTEAAPTSAGRDDLPYSFDGSRIGLVP
ncbi:MAG TPA: hypothetical protein VGU71_22190 [Candidatus Dormibacteraeota bacterium]|nr:hypothetical protein [Candidatus Dormibacteraeota bacterium]